MKGQVENQVEESIRSFRARQTRAKMEKFGANSTSEVDWLGFSWEDVAHPRFLEDMLDDLGSFEELNLRKAVLKFLNRLINESKYSLTMNQLSNLALGFLEGWQTAISQPVR